MDYLSLITPEHKEQPKFTAWLTAALSMVQDAQNLLNNLYSYYDIDRAIGAQLDVIGQILGKPRRLPWQPHDYFNIPVTGKTTQAITEQSEQKLDKDKTTSGYINNTTGAAGATSYNNYVSPLIAISPSTEYKILGHTYTQPSGNVGLAWYDATGAYISGVSYGGVTGNGTYTSPATAYYARYTINSADLSTSIFEIQTSSNTDTAFTPDSPSPDYPSSIVGTSSITVTDGGSNSQPVTLPITLYNTANVSDTFDAVTGQGIRHTAEITLNGSEEWAQIWEAGTKTIAFAYYDSAIKDGSDDSIRGYCNKLPVKAKNAAYNDDTEQCIIGGTDNPYIAIRINKARLATQDAAGFKTWLASNNITMLYELAAQQSISETPPTIPTYRPKTYVYRSDGLLINTYTFSPVLDDTNYRIVLKAVVAEAHFDGTAPGLYNLFQTALGNTGLYFAVTDNQDMSLSVIVYGQTTSLIRDELEHGYIVPRPEGVKLIINVTVNRVFAWGINNDVFSGWGAGYWLLQGG